MREFTAETPRRGERTSHLPTPSFRTSAPRRLRGSIFLALLLVVLGALPVFAQDDLPPTKPGVRITFLPPPMDGTLSLGIYDQKGRLVRVLAREATQKDFTVGLNGFITHWDGKDDSGKPAPAGSYDIRGYSVGAVDVEGIAMHGNDWITDDAAPRPAKIIDLRTKAPDEIEAALETFEGPAAARADPLETEAGSRPTPDEVVTIADGKITLMSQGQTRTFPLAEGESAIDATLGAKDRLWVIVQTPAGREVRAFTLDGEFLRRLGYAPGDPLPRRILAARARTFAERWSEQIVLLEESDQLQRVRSLALPQKPAADDAPLWRTVFEKANLARRDLRRDQGPARASRWETIRAGKGVHRAAGQQPAAPGRTDHRACEHRLQ